MLLFYVGSMLFTCSFHVMFTILALRITDLNGDSFSYFLLLPGMNSKSMLLKTLTTNLKQQKLWAYTDG